MLKDPSLRSLRVLVTAGASGIGLQIARGFVDAGAQVMVCDVSEQALNVVREELPQLCTCLADVSDETSVAELFAVLDRQLGGLDVLINNAGIAGPTGPVETLSRSDFARTLEVNVTGQFLCARAAVPRLRRGRNPSILNMSSAAGHLGMPGRSAYSASKWAVIGFTKSLALELGRDGIRVNAVLPGAVDGPRIRAVIAAKAASVGKPVEQVTADYEGQSALGRMVTAEDIANQVLFVSSEAGRSTTGQALAVDGLTQALS